MDSTSIVYVKFVYISSFTCMKAATLTLFSHFAVQVSHTKKEILDTLFNGLKRLEYRGYDSAGVSIDLPVVVSLICCLCIIVNSLI